MVTEVVFWQLLLSVTVSVYVPADNALMKDDVRLLLHLKVYGLTPPEAEPVAFPLFCPKQVTLFEVALAWTGVGEVMVVEAVAVQPIASVIVTVYVPAGKLMGFCWLPMVLRFQLKVNGCVPAKIIKLIAPVEPPLQATIEALGVIIGFGFKLTIMILEGVKSVQPTRRATRT